MGTKAQLINFIIENFTEPDGNPITKSRLDSFKKADLEEFITTRGVEEEFVDWLAR